MEETTEKRVSAKKRASNDKYNAKCDLHPHKPVGEAIRNAARLSDMSLQGYILQAIYEQMERDGTPIVKEC